MYPKLYKKLMEYFMRFSGIGKKTAEKMVQELLMGFSIDDLTGFSNAIKNSKDIKRCHICNIFSDNDTCPICESLENDKILLIVENSIDAFNIIKTNSFNGYYHIINNLIDYTKGITEDSIDINKLLIRINNFNEIIIALNSTVQGEFTAQYLINKILEQDPSKKISRIGYGIPYGSELKYIGGETLKRAITNRVLYKRK